MRDLLLDILALACMVGAFAIGLVLAAAFMP